MIRLFIQFITKLEHSKAFLSLLVICTFFFLLRIPSIAEPYWYGDEGIYQVIGQALNQGRILYTSIWDNKPPLLYLVYALFNGDQASIRFLSLIFGIAATITLFFLARQLFQKWIPSIITAILFTLLFATPFLEGNIANAENFILFPIIVAGLILYHLTIKKRIAPSPQNAKALLAAGLLLGVAFMFKIVAIFDLAAFASFLLLSTNWKMHPKSETKIALRISYFFIPIIIGFLLPFLITIFYFASIHALPDFIKGAFFGNVEYVGYENSFLTIPQGLLIIKVLLLGLALFFIFVKRNFLSRPALFILLWLTFSLFNAFFSQRPYTHYLLILLPSFCLLVGLFFTSSAKNTKIVLVTLIISITILIGMSFHVYGIEKTLSYYQNISLFMTGQKDVKAYQSFFDDKAPRDYEVALFIKKHTTASDNVFIWGNNAQIYALSHKLPPNKYTVAYHVVENKDAITDTQNALTSVKPKYIITLSEAPLLPFRVPLYKIRFMFPKATIYERDF